VSSVDDRYGTWKTALPRSRRWLEVFAGKVVAALSLSLLAMTILGVSSIAAGLLMIGSDPLVSLSGALLPASRAMTRVTLAWISVLPPMFGMTAVAVLLSVATRNSATGIGLPVVAALVMQLYALVDGPEIVRRMLLTSAFV